MGERAVRETGNNSTGNPEEEDNIVGRVVVDFLISETVIVSGNMTLTPSLSPRNSPFASPMKVDDNATNTRQLQYTDLTYLRYEISHGNSSVDPFTQGNFTATERANFSGSRSIIIETNSRPVHISYGSALCSKSPNDNWGYIWHSTTSESVCDLQNDKRCQRKKTR